MSHQTVEHCPCDLWPIASFLGSSRVHKQLVFQKRNKAFNSLTAIFFLKILCILLGTIFHKAYKSLRLRQRCANKSPQPRPVPKMSMIEVGKERQSYLAKNTSKTRQDYRIVLKLIFIATVHFYRLFKLKFSRREKQFPFPSASQIISSFCLGKKGTLAVCDTG